MENDFLQPLKKHANLLLRLLPIVAFAVPLLWLYLLEPASFEAMWKGRTFQLFFVWLVSLELVLGWESFPKFRLSKLASTRTIAFIVTLVLPTLYVAASYYWGLNQAIYTWSTQQDIVWANTMALATEYLVFAALFLVLVYLGFGFRGIKAFSVPAFFLVLVGAIYMIDNLFPYGQFTPFQIFVPTTTTLAATFLNIMGYSTNIAYIDSASQGTMPFLTATSHTGAYATFSIAWPCAGIESFLIFTVVTLLFLKRMHISLKSKVGYFVFGAAVTYIINAFRIVNIFLAGIQYGENSSQVLEMHLYYGPLYAVAWIVSYPLLIILVNSLWQRHKNRRSSTGTQPVLPNPA
jgi:thaumarchaeosortase